MLFVFNVFIKHTISGVQTFQKRIRTIILIRTIEYFKFLIRRLLFTVQTSSTFLNSALLELQIVPERQMNKKYIYENIINYGNTRFRLFAVFKFSVF